MAIVLSEQTFARIMAVVEAAERQRGGSGLPVAGAAGGLLLDLLQIGTDWTASAFSDDIGGSSVAAGQRLTPSNHASEDAANRFALSAASGSQISIDLAAADRVAVGMRVTLINCSQDDGEYIVTAKAETSTLDLTLDRSLSTGTLGDCVLPGARTLQAITEVSGVGVISRHRHDLVIAGRVRGEWLALTRPRCRGYLDGSLNRATVDGSTLTPAEATLSVWDFDDAGDWVDTNEDVLIRNLDESLSLAGGTFCVADLCGDKWEIIWASCNVSALPD